LVVGARPESLGDVVAGIAIGQGYEVITAGLHEEDKRLNVDWHEETLMERLLDINPTHIVVTAGINKARDSNEYREMGRQSARMWYLEHLAMNCVGPMALLEAWGQTVPVKGSLGHYVVISSNSAHIARTASAAYCASKAALSMAVRSVAREWARRDAPIIAYGYEPGMLAGTPMTMDVANRLVASNFDRGVALHRMPGVLPDGIPPEKLARLIVHNLRHGGRELNGTMLRIDAGEQ
jgi:NAD(P)-dependent dehydrogenase (short-subunit alcohol dehydrogenase family)